MGLYIKGMEMPEHCDECYIREKNICPLTKTNVTGWGIPLNCPLAPVPPHGRLIDADELFKEMERKGWFDNADRDEAEDLVLDAPTIIPEEERET